MGYLQNYIEKEKMNKYERKAKKINPNCYWTLGGNKVENMAVVPLVKGVSIHNTIRKRHEARMERGKKVGVRRSVRR